MFTAAQLLAMSDTEIATIASGSYGAEKRGEMMRSIRAAAEKADAKVRIVEQLRGLSRERA